MSHHVAGAAALCVMLAAPPAAADEPSTRGEDVELRHDLRVDLPLTIGLAAGIFTYAVFLRPDLSPSSCRWCEGSGPDGVNRLDRVVREALVREDVRPASFASNVLSYGLAPVATGVLLALSANHEGRLKNAPVDLLILAEAALIAVAVDEAVKAVVVRERPSVHWISDEDSYAEESRKVGAMHSFPAGHSLAVFAFTSAAGTIAGMRRYSLAPLIWIAGSMLGVTTSYLRIAADQHYLTDTLGGAAIGLAVGAAVPWFFHPPVAPGASSGPMGGVRAWLGRARLTTQPVPSGRTVSLTVAF